MTQEFVTLPREVVENALDSVKNLFERDCEEDFLTILEHEAIYNAVQKLRAALEQPQNHVPDAGNMVPAGWKLVPVEPGLMTQAALNAAREWPECDAPLPRGRELWAAGLIYRAMLDAAPKPPVVEQPQVEQPAIMTPVARRKLAGLLGDGWAISGYSVYHERKHQHGFVTGAGLVGWWKPDGVEYPQPQGEQEPVAWRLFDDDPIPGTKPKWVYYDKDDFVNGVDPTKHFQLECLYTHPQPKREPLTDEQIADAMRGLYSSDEAAKLGFPDDACTARAIERAHNIK